MADEGSSILRGLLTPDAIAGMAAAVIASLVSAMRTNVRGVGVLVSNAAAAVLTGAGVIPLAQSRGYGWGDWLFMICLMTGLFSGTLFLLCARIAERILARSDAIADSVIDRVAKDKSKEP